MLSRGSFVLVAAVAWALVTASGAIAAPPPNDARAAAQPLGDLPADVRGTTAESGLDADEFSGCAPMRGSVWYGFDAGETRSIVVAVDAEGELDAVVDVFVRERSQITPAFCRRTNRRGALTFELDAEAGTSYLVRVASLANSVDGRFRLRVIEPERPARFPGERLPRGGASAFVDRLANPDDVWSVRLQRGIAYRMNLVSSGGRCAFVEFQLPGAGDVVRRLRCDAHTVYVPSASGLHTLHVQAPRASRDRIGYRLRVGRAQADDTAPGIRLANDQGVRGALRGGRARRGRSLSLLDRYEEHAEAHARYGRRLRAAAARRHGGSHRVGRGRARAPARAGALLRRGSGSRRRGWPVHAPPARAGHHPLGHARRGRHDRAGGFGGPCAGRISGGRRPDDDAR